MFYLPHQVHSRLSILHQVDTTHLGWVTSSQDAIVALPVILKRDKIRRAFYCLSEVQFAWHCCERAQF